MAPGKTLLAFTALLLIPISNLKLAHGDCEAKGYLQGTSGPCGGDDECCVAGESYPEYDCSPPVTGSTPAILTLNNFSDGGDGGGPSECDNRYHDNSEKVISLSTGWYNGGSRCGKNIWIGANGNSVLAQVVDECDSVNGCDDEHDYQPPCRNNIVDASQAVWDALGIGSNVGEYQITWSDA